MEQNTKENVPGTTEQLDPKDKIKQRPIIFILDLFDENGNSFTTYTNTILTGTKLFSYKIGTGAVDPELGFALSTPKCTKHR